MAVTLALLAAFAFALGSVLQQKGTLEAPAGEDDLRFLVQILHRPVWLMGGGMLAAGWVLQAAALARGPLEVVQSLCALSLVIALPLGARITNQLITKRVWHGAEAMVVGIVLFVAASGTEVSHSLPTAADWWSAAGASLVALGILGTFGRLTHGSTRALLLGSAAGVAFAFQAAVTKVFVPLVGQGLSAILTSWTPYALLVSALIGFVVQQSALKTGVLASAMASSSAVTLFASVALGSALFGEDFSRGGAWAGATTLGLALALVGIVLLSGAQAPPAEAPATDAPPTPRLEAGPR
jgi:drug/metabolite transporter (DMT)-like permease